MTERRIEALRAAEASCYGVCLHVLREEKNAAMAAQAALRDLYRDETFWTLPEENRERRIRKAAAVRALQWSAGR